MNAADTNVLARLILQDDPGQAQAARVALGRPTWISNTVWVELGWVLGRKLKLDRAFVSDALSTILELDTIHTADRAGLRWAVQRYRAGADWADMVHLVAAHGAADCFITLDRDLAQEAGDASPIVVETLA